MASLPDHIAKAMMTIVSNGTSIDTSYALFKKTFLAMDFTKCAITPIEWVEKIGRQRYHNTSLTNPRLATQAMTSLLSSINNEIHQFQKNNITNDTPAQFTIPITIINHQQVQTQHVNQQAVQSQTVVAQYCDLKLYSEVIAECIEYSNPIKLIIKASSKFHPPSFASHSTKRCCEHNGNGFKFRCKTCKEGKVDGWDKEYQVNINNGKASVCNEWKLHLESLHRLTKAELLTFQEKLKQKQQKTKNGKKRSSRWITDTVSSDDRKKKKHKHKHERKQRRPKKNAYPSTNTQSKPLKWKCNSISNTNTNSAQTPNQAAPFSLHTHSHCNGNDDDYGDETEDDDIDMKH
eukprot:204159_1